MVPNDLSTRTLTPLIHTFDVDNLSVGHAIVVVDSIRLWLDRTKKELVRTTTEVEYLLSLSVQSPWPT